MQSIERSLHMSSDYQPNTNDPQSRAALQQLQVRRGREGIGRGFVSGLGVFGALERVTTRP